MLVTLLVSHLGIGPNFGSSAHIPSTGFVLMHFSMASLNVSSVRNCCVSSFTLMLLLFLLLSFLLAFPFSAQSAPFPRDKEESTRRTSSARRRERRERRELPEDAKEEDGPFLSFLDDEEEEEEEEEEDASKR